MRGNFQTFLDEVCSYISWKEARQDVRCELEAHLEDRVTCYESNGKDCEEAVSLALKDMGSCEEIGLALDRQHRPQMDWNLVALTAVITMFGAVLMVCSKVNGFAEYTNVPRYIMSILLGFGTAVALIRFQYKRLLHHSMAMYLVLLLLLQCSALLTTPRINGKPYFLTSLGISVSVDLLFCLFLIPLSGILYKYRGGGWLELLKWVGMCALVFFTGLLRTPSITNTGLFAICAAVLLLTAIGKGHFRGKRRYYFAGVFASGIMAAGLSVLLLDSYQQARLLNLVSPDDKWNYPTMIADQWRQAAPMVGSSSGLSDAAKSGDIFIEGNGVYALTGIISSLGWIAGIVLLVAVTLFLVKMILTVSKVKDGYGRYLATACCSVIVVKFIINILVNFGFFTYTAVNMPLVSYGGWEFVQNMIFIGLILSIWSRNRLSQGGEEGTDQEQPDEGLKFLDFTDGRLTVDFNVFGLREIAIGSSLKKAIHKG